MIMGGGGRGVLGRREEEEKITGQYHVKKTVERYRVRKLKKDM